MDPQEKGYLMEEELRKLLKGKSGISADDIEEMITEYKVYHCEERIPFLDFTFIVVIGSGCTMQNIKPRP